MTTSTASSLTEDKDPPVMVFLPKHDRANSRILSLENPRNGEPNKYLFDPSTGVFEFKKISPPRESQRSVLTVYDTTTPDEASTTDKAASAQVISNSKDGYINKTAFALVATPIDPIWLVLPILSPAYTATKSEPSKRLFKPLDDLFDLVPETSTDIHFLLNHESFRQILAGRMEMICDTVDAGNEKMYRLSEEKLVKTVVGIAEQFGEAGLPSSMEERFVRLALETPVLAIKRADITTTDPETQEPPSVAENQSGISITGTRDTQSTTTESQTSISTPTATTISTPATELSSFTSTTPDPKPSGPSPSILSLQRIHTVLTFILSSYIPPHISKLIRYHLTTPSAPTSFEPLTAHLAHLQSLRAEALASRSFGDFSRKRGLDDENEGAESRAEKKRRMEEEEKRRKTGESRGVRDLKKVDVSGMKKMSDFFKKAAPKAKA
jgi:hypothetical protein